MRTRAFVIVLKSLAILSGCAVTPLETEEAQELRQRASIPRIVYIEVHCEGDEAKCLGIEDVWISDVTRALRDLDVAADVWSEADGERPEEADLTVTLTLAPHEEKGQPQVVGTEALLSFLAWSTLPLVPLWLKDVQVVPNLDVKVVLSLGGNRETPDLVPKLLTSFRERYPVFSWQMLGAVFVPPFVFRDGQDEHLATSVAARVRAEVAWKLARFLKDWSQGEEELLRHLEVEKEPSGKGYRLVFEASPDLWYLDLRYESRNSKPEPTEPFRVGRRGWTEEEQSLSELLGEPGRGGDVLRISAVGRAGGSAPRVVSYSVRVKEEA